jgi:hypothetical protein
LLTTSSSTRDDKQAPVPRFDDGEEEEDITIDENSRYVDDYEVVNEEEVVDFFVGEPGDNMLEQEEGLPNILEQEEDLPNPNSGTPGSRKRKKL